VNIEPFKERLRELESELSGRTTGVEGNSTVLQHVRDALERIRRGRFGKCVVDGGSIDAERLEAVPWTPYCLEHKDFLETGAPGGGNGATIVPVQD